MHPTFTALVLAGSLLASAASPLAPRDRLWSLVSSLWSADEGARFDPSGLTVDEGCRFDPNGCPTTDAGLIFDPDGLTFDAGLIFDPNG